MMISRGAGRNITVGILAAALVGGSSSAAAPSRGVADLDPVPVPQGLSTQSLLLEAREKISSEKWAEAIVLLKSYLGDDYDASRVTVQRDLSVRMNLVRALTELGRREEALGMLERALDRLGGNSAARPTLIRRVRTLATLFLEDKTFELYQEGLAFLRTRQVAESHERIEKALAREPDHVLVLLAAGQVQLLQGNGGSAYEKFKYAEHLEPRHPQVQLWLGRAELVRGERLKAISCLERALDRKSSQAVGEGGLELEEHDAALIWLAEAYSADGKKNKGLALLGGAINGARPSLAIVLSWLRTQGLAQLVREKNVSLAIQTLRTAMTGAGTGEFNWIFSSQDLQLEAADWLTALQGKRE